LFSILLFALCLGAAAQETIVSDTSYIENRQGVFWQVKTQVYARGRIVSDQTPLGSDTSAVAQAILGPVFAQFSQYGQMAARVQTQYARQRQALGAANATLMALLGINYLTITGNEVGEQFLGAYTMRVNGGQPIAGEVIRLGSGALRWRQGGQNFVFDVMSPYWIRLRSYDSIAILDLYRDEATDSWVDFSQGIGTIKYRLRR